jgi:class 3 adenylate cyclase
LIESEMKKVVAKRVKREEAQPESAKPSEKSEPEIEAAIMALPLETQTLHDRLGEMLEEFGSWVDYRVRLDEEVLVVAFDLCSSSMIMEQLLLGGDLSCLTDLLTAIKRHLAAEQRHLLFDPYKFTGDGWILLFPANTDGSALMAFLERLCRFYSDKYRRLIKPNLQNVPKIAGLSFGIDRGWVSRMKMYGQAEYIGRPIIVACRLQGAVKDKGGSPAYKALVTYHAYRKHFTHLPASRAVRVKRILRNINAETPFGCKKIALLSR